MSASSESLPDPTSCMAAATVTSLPTEPVKAGVDSLGERLALTSA
jgi:hypothetical protein